MPKPPEPPKTKPGANRPAPPNPEGVQPSKRVRYESPPPISAPEVSTHFPNTLHFVVVGELSPYQADYIQLWARKNPGYTVKVWRDNDSIYGSIGFRNQVEDVYSGAVVMAAQSNYEIIRSQIQGWATEVNRRVEEVMSNQLSRERATQETFASLDFDTKENLEAFKINQDFLYDRLSTPGTPETAEIQIQEISDLFAGAENTAYHDAAYINNDFQLAESIVRQWAL